MRKRIIIAGSVLLILIIILFISTFFRKNNTTVTTTTNNTSIVSPTGINEKTSGSDSNSIFNLFGLLGGSKKPNTVSPTPDLNSSNTNSNINDTNTTSGSSNSVDPNQTNSDTSSDSSTATEPLSTYQSLMNAAEQKIKSVLPFENEHVKISYSPILGKLIAVKKDTQADTEIRNWLKQNNLQGLENESQIIQTINPNTKNTTDPVVKEKLNFLKTHPYVSEDFSVTYDPKTDLFGVEQKTTNARKAFDKWAKDNGIFQATDNRNIFVFTGTDKPVNDSTVDKTIQPLEDLFSVMFAPPPTFAPVPTSASQPTNITTTPTISSSPGITSTISPIASNPPTAGDKIYYAQCAAEYRNIVMPNGGCSFCNTGCGLASVAMILSSNINKSYDPQYIVDYYKDNGYKAGCYTYYDSATKTNKQAKGSDFAPAVATLKAHGMTVDDPIFFNTSSTTTVAKKLKPYVDKGWTFMMLMYSAKSGMHFQWITDIDENGTMWANDPYLGTPPLKLNDIAITYKATYGVKKI